MYLSQLNMIGFKSFAQKTSLKFNDGISCIIGPNGSGKSNIVDAIRWVLGEQKVSILRSDKMENIIFNGTHTRKPLGFAEVSLTVNNNKNILDNTFSELVIARRLYRSGESQYLMNKVPCRLKDILDIFMDTGMGANAYSVIELKMVEDILSDNQSDRRFLFEEAAGITKYKIRRKSALRKMEMTRQDMSRISDIISEINRNVNSLSRQVGKARRYLKYQEELKQKEVELARFRYTQLIDELGPLQKQLKEISLIKEDASHQITLEEALLEDYKREIISIEQLLFQHNKELQEQDDQIHQIKEKTAVANTRIQLLLDSQKRNENEIADAGTRIEHLNLELIESKKSLEEMEKAQDIAQKLFTGKEEEYKEYATLLNEEKIKIDELNSGYKSLYEELVLNKEQAQQKSFQLNWNEEQLKIMEQEKEQYLAFNNTVKNDVGIIKQKKEKFAGQLKSIEKNIIESNSEIVSLEQTIRNTSEILQKRQYQLEGIKEQLHFFEQVISKHEGFSEGTQYLMQHIHNFKGVRGPLSDLIEVEDTYKIIIENIIGDALNFLVVDNIDSAKNILHQISKQNIGRVTLIPLDRVNRIAIKERKESLPFPRLLDKISSKKVYDKIFEILLGDIYLVDSLDDALKASDDYSEYRFVSLSGECINFSQAISGGGKTDSKIALIGRKENLNKLRENIERLETEEKKLKKELNVLEEKLQKEKHTLEINRQKKEDIINQIQEVEKEEAQIQYKLNSKKETHESRYGNKGKIVRIISAFKTDLEQINREMKQKEMDLEEYEKRMISQTKKYDQKNGTLQLLTAEVRSLQVKLINCQNDHLNKQSDINRIENNIKELISNQEKRKNENNEITDELSRIEKQKVEWTEIQKHVYEKRDSIDNEKEDVQDKYNDIKNKIIQLEDQIKRYRKQHASSLERSRQLELQIQENKLKSDNIIERIKEEYGEDITLGIAYSGLNVEEYETNIESIKFKIKQLGQVNPLAVSEYEKETERLEFYQKQYNDLIEAEKSLEKTINKINVKARELFLTSFEKIEKNFQIVFKKFFENGEGSLKLEENTDPLEANIEIYIRPKGKRVQTLALLSGGEKTLAAISLLFAIYLEKPSPFCILDEIDAPLDDVNIERFTQALKSFSINTQFIVVTHNKRTMEAADTLYGVTMEEEGLSKLVSVKFN
jgi:chromosome segregation protein